MSDPELDAALRDLEEDARRGRRASPYLARELLISLGRRIEAGAEVEGELSRIREASATLGPRWDETLRGELSLAVGEFVQSVDPRYLELPNYDFEYTTRARARLEHRLRAAGALDLALEEREAELLALADAVWSARLARGSAAPAGKAPEGRPPSSG